MTKTDPDFITVRYRSLSHGVLDLTFKFGLIAPPTIDLHEPMVGTVTFVHEKTLQTWSTKEPRERSDGELLP